jgi:hypothetical protein
MLTTSDGLAAKPMVPLHLQLRHIQPPDDLSEVSNSRAPIVDLTRHETIGIAQSALSSEADCAALGAAPK